MTKTPSQLNQLTTPEDDDIIIINDTSTGETKHMNREDFFSGIMPPGVITGFGGGTAPEGWLLCDGEAVSRSTYADLFSAIGTAWGAGDGSTTFNVPNLKGKTFVGYDAGQTEFDTIGESGGAKTHTLTSGEMPSHAHTVNDPGHNHGISDPGHSHSSNTSGQTVFTAPSTNTTTDNRGGGYQQITWGNTSTSHNGTGVAVSGNTTGVTLSNTGSGQAHNNLQPYAVGNFIIKI